MMGRRDGRAKATTTRGMDGWAEAMTTRRIDGRAEVMTATMVGSGDDNEADEWTG